MLIIQCYPFSRKVPQGFLGLMKVLLKQELTVAVALSVHEIKKYKENERIRVNSDTNR